MEFRKMENLNNSTKVFLQDDNFKRSFNLDASDSLIYENILNIPLWWTEMFEGCSRNQGDIFTVRFGPCVFKTIVVLELIPFKKIAWKVLDSFIGIPELKNKTEWINTFIVWEIMPNENYNTLTLTHNGLTPRIECYTICENGWYDFTNSLIDYIKRGIGRPYKSKE